MRITTKGESEHEVHAPAPTAHRIKAYLAAREDLYASPACALAAPDPKY
jgi:hypothetical protein